MNGLATVDRYDIAVTLVLGLIMVCTLALGAPLWTVPIVLFVDSVIVFIHHFDDP